MRLKETNTSAASWSSSRLADVDESHRNEECFLDFGFLVAVDNDNDDDNDEGPLIGKLTGLIPDADFAREETAAGDLWKRLAADLFFGVVKSPITASVLLLLLPRAAAMSPKDSS